MTAAAIDDRFSLPIGEPLGLLRTSLTPPAALGATRCEELEFSCRGDRVRCILSLPEGPHPAPLVLTSAETAGDGPDPTAALAPFATWIRAGCGVASIDLPLHGSRRSAKLSEDLAATASRAVAGRSISGASELLFREYTRQAVLELRAALCMLAARPDLDAGRIGFAGLGLGAWAGAIACGLDPERPAAVALGLVGGGFEPADLDPASHVAAIGSRPLLLLHTGGAEGAGVRSIPARAAERLHAAAPESARIEQVEPRTDALWTSAFEFLTSELAPMDG